MVLQELDFLYDDKIRNEIEGEKDEDEKLRKKLDVIKKLLNLKSDKDFQEFINEVHNRCFLFEQSVSALFILG